MPKLLTDAGLRGLRGTPGKRDEVADELVPGLRLRVSGRSKTWILRQRAGGKVRTVTLGQFGSGSGELTLAAARTKAVEVQGDIREGKVPVAARTPARDRRGPSVREAIDRFMAEYCPDKEVKRPEAYRWQFDKYVVPRFGDWRIAAIGKNDLREFLRSLRDTHGLTTSRRVGGLCKRFFRWCAKQDIIEADPMALVDLPGKEAVRRRTLKDAELKVLWQATDPASNVGELNKAGRPKVHPSMYPWGAYFRLLLLLGQRRGEVANMRWDAIDLEARTWTLEPEETKADRSHIVPLPDPAVEILESLPRLTCQRDGETVLSAYVLTTRGHASISAFSKAKGWLDTEMERLHGSPIPDWRIHDLRRTVSTALSSLGVLPHIRRAVLNHALEGVDRVYDQFDFLEPKRQALDLWAKRLGEIGDGKPSGSNVVSLKGGK